jgi:hypothetical protein
MPAIENLIYTVNVWSEDQLDIVEVIAAANCPLVAEAAFRVACRKEPNKIIGLNGPGILTTRRPQRRPGAPSRSSSRGVTNDPARIAAYCQAALA